jgi:hypothetical protein
MAYLFWYQGMDLTIHPVGIPFVLKAGISPMFFRDAE